MSFLHPSLIGLPLLLAAVPVAIHLINLLRHRRVPWAAMEFLLASQKRNRHWVLLRQWLLMAARVAVIAVLVLMLAGWFLPSGWARVFGGGRTHHIVLVDDGFPTGARAAGASAIDRAGDCVRRIAARTASQETPQRFTMLRFSQAARWAEGAGPDLLAAETGADFLGHVETVCRQLKASDRLISPSAALDAAARLVDGQQDESYVVHVVSDFRKSAWGESPALAQKAALLRQRGAKLNLIDCATESAPNLAITELSPAPRTRAAGVPLVMFVTVKNFGSEAVDDVLVAIDVAEHPRGTGETIGARAAWKKLPSLQIESIGPGEEIRRSVQVQFETAGGHQVRVRLEGDRLASHDALAADNLRETVVETAAQVPILLIDGNSKDDDAFHVTKVFRPGGETRTGLAPVTQPPEFLRDADLNAYDAIYLLNVRQLDPSAVAALQAYVRGGGGLAVFTGRDTDRSFVNTQLYRDGKGLFPLPLLGPGTLIAQRDPEAPDILVDDKSSLAAITPYFSDQPRPTIDRYMRVEPSWRPAPDSGVRLLATLRNGAPLVAAHRFGKGRVVAVLTGAGREWSNWPVTISYILFLHELQGIIAADDSATGPKLVGEPLSIPVDTKRFLENVTVRTPRPDGDPLALLELAARDASAQRAPGTKSTNAPTDSTMTSSKIAPSTTTPSTMTVSIGAGASGETDVVGTYQAELTARGGASEIRRFALNLDTSGGDLTAATPQQLAAATGSADDVYLRHDQLRDETQAVAGMGAGELLAFVLIAMLVGEQLLAFAASYHRRLAHDRGESP